jgi:hypothetical protein
VTAELDAAGAAFTVDTPSDIASLWIKAARGELASSAAACETVISGKSGAAKRSWERIRDLLGTGQAGATA